MRMPTRTPAGNASRPVASEATVDHHTPAKPHPQAAPTHVRALRASSATVSASVTGRCCPSALSALSRKKCSCRPAEGMPAAGSEGSQHAACRVSKETVASQLMLPQYGSSAASSERRTDCRTDET